MRITIMTFFTILFFVTISHAQKKESSTYPSSTVEGLADIGNGKQNIYTYDEAVRALTAKENGEFQRKSAKTVSLGEQIKNARVKRNCSQEKLAELTGLNVVDINNIETNFAVPTMDILLNIQEYLGTEFIMK